MSEMPTKTQTMKLISGMEVEMRKLTLADESLLASVKRSTMEKAEKVLRQIMDRCTVGVVNPGPYSFLTEGKNVPWKKVLSGDVIDAMLQLRIFSYREGNKLFVPKVKCDTCRASFDWEIDIQADLRRQPLPEESRAIMGSGRDFEFELDGYRIFFKLSSGDTEGLYRKFAKQNPGRDMACGLRSKITKVLKPDGTEIPTNDILDWLDGNDGKSKEYPGLLSDEAEDIRDHMDLVDGGVDLEVEAVCPEPDCGETVYFSLPFGSIFVPGSKIRKRRASRRGKESSDT